MGGDEFQKNDQNPFFTLRDSFVAHHNQAREELFQKLTKSMFTAKFHNMYFQFSHECHFHKASTLSQVDAELTRDRFVAMLNDAGFFLLTVIASRKNKNQIMVLHIEIEIMK